MENKKPFKPYVPADKITPEITVVSVILGIILAVVFGAANAYLGLKVGMTVSASIPAAVISMGVIRVIMRRNSILENNIVQTIGSAGESLAAGAIFTLPAIFMWASDKNSGIDKPGILEMTLIALIGGLLGVFFMIPLRNALIVKEHGTLPYPEGTACAEVLLAGENTTSSASKVFIGMGFAALFKFLIDGLKVIPEQISLKVKGFAGEIGTQPYPALFSVGFICGPRISSFMFAGSCLAWLVLIPLIVVFGGNTVMFPADVPISQLFAEGGAAAIRSKYIVYIGAGALAAGGIISLIKSLPTIASAFTGAIKSMAGAGKAGQERTSKDINMVVVIIAIIALAFAIWLIPAIPVSLLGAFIIVIFGFFFATVSSRMVGLVGSSNNPVSGMAIATLLITTLILVSTGQTGPAGKISAIAIGSVICIVSAIAGDTSQDLKTGYILGSTPKKQQIGELIGVIASALTIGGTLYILEAAYGFGGDALPAAQGTIMKTIVDGIMDGNLPWNLVIIGAFIAVFVEIIGIPVLPFAIGIYLPIHMNACIMIGGLVRLVFNKLNKSDEEKKEIENNGILFCSGMIAGEGLIGVIIALLTILGVADTIIVKGISQQILNLNAIALITLIILLLCIFTFPKKNKKTKE